MLRSILIGLDSSASGLAAQELGVQWAQQLGCRLAGIAIVDNPGSPLNKGTMSSGVSYHGTESTLVGEPRAKAAAVLQAVEDAFGRRCGEAGVAFQLVEDIGSPHVRILLEAQKHDIVLLGQRSHFEFGWEAKPGETLEKVLQDSPRPVVVVPGTLRPGTSIAVCYDGSLQAARALASFVGTGLGRGCTVHVIAAEADRLQAALHTERGARVPEESRARRHVSHRRIDAPPCRTDPEESPAARRRPARHGCLRPVGAQGVLPGLGDLIDLEGEPHSGLLLSLRTRSP